MNLDAVFSTRMQIDGEIPLVLAGPILRRVTKSSVSVWIALRQEASVHLKIYGPNYGISLFEGVRKTIRLGSHLHVVVVTARLADSPGAQNDPLKPGITYYYDLEFIGDGLDGDTSLQWKGVLHHKDAPTDLEKLVYPGHSLPSFELPAKNRDKLRIVHGSCRKPHGGGIDALALLDGFIGESLKSGNSRPRPQQLYLTGDQIYADDVADLMLQAATDIGDTLTGHNENLPALQDGRTEGRDIKPGERKDIILDKKSGFGAAMTSDDSRSHLFTEAEFYAMYLLAWSNVVWAGKDVTSSIYSSTPSGPYYGFGANLTENQDKLQVFFKGLASVRRALANIPVYMIFDDHEISDDWFLDGLWGKRALKSKLGRRILRNGLTAYAVFQAWGNDPDQFEPDQKGGKFLKDLDSWDRKEGTAKTTRIELALGIPAPGSFSGYGQIKKTSSAIDWHYTVDWDGGQAVVLDTRTQRYYHEPRSPSELISEAAVSEQLKAASSSKPYTLAIVPSPILGHEITEFVQYTTTAAESWWDLGKSLVLGEDRESSNYTQDYETWSASSQAVGRILSGLRPFREVICLSGDVHYSFSGRLQMAPLWHSGVQDAATIASLTSSSLHNQSGGTMINHHLGYGGILYEATKFIKQIPPFTHDILDLKALEGATYVLCIDTDGAEKKYTKYNTLSYTIGIIQLSFKFYDWMWGADKAESGSYICRSVYFEQDGGVAAFYNLDGQLSSNQQASEKTMEMVGKALDTISVVFKNTPDHWNDFSDRLSRAMTTASFGREALYALIGGLQVVGRSNIGEVHFSQGSVIHDVHWQGFYDDQRRTRLKIHCAPVSSSGLRP
ncbi:hypothetical protein [Hyphobacterium sp.]|uniref:hypothetical protein n=1 Tax=Hyphobacterium sp. TaxID=2004662 RepID=UPI003BABFA59